MSASDTILTWLIENWQSVLPIVVVVFGWWVAARIAGRARLIYGRANNSFHTVKVGDSEELFVYCEKYYVQNTGTKAATNVEVSFSDAPTGLSTYPPVDYISVNSPSGELILQIPSISPKELIIIDTIHLNKKTAEILSVRSSEVVGKLVPFWVQRKYGLIVNMLIVTIMVLGAYFGFYLILSLVGYLFSLSVS